MRRNTLMSTTMLCAWALCLTGCGGPGAGAPQAASGTPHDDSKVLNLYIWADYLAPDTISNFEKQTGIKVRVSYFETNETLESRMLTGHSG
ncbi:MAG TPA: polyamine ABC transporter substrate-binding protein, partial [Pseudomonadota bacterium]|nr:polyamine ABC transporter substrate-binding protein [Pseudomonadota bacterium]